MDLGALVAVACLVPFLLVLVIGLWMTVREHQRHLNALNKSIEAHQRHLDAHDKAIRMRSVM